MAGKYRLQIAQGTTVRRGLVWKRNGVPVDLTGCRARMEYRTSVGGPLVHRFDAANGGLTIDESTNTINLYITPATSSAWTQLSGVYDLEVVFPNNDVVRLIEGSVTVSPEVTTGE
ncbi:hypothetical protein AB0G06_43625 [Nonomuraea dietziae]|uniref:hypothetical protein n=1 Tax=Nonomuraea dietziae TaxID=65515 RepID=UPI0033C2CDE3